MPKIRGKHLTKTDREVIEAGITSCQSARSIARQIGASPSTVTREVEKNRTVREAKLTANTKASIRCVHYAECQKIATACKSCENKHTECKRCTKRQCILTCSNFVRKTCEVGSRWPYICPSNCKKRAYCGYPRYFYDANAANEMYKERLSVARSGLCVTEDELKTINEIVIPLVKQGQSLEAIWLSHGHELFVSLRTAYRYQAYGAIKVGNIDMPKKVRLSGRNRARPYAYGPRINRRGRTYKDFEALPAKDRVRVVQGDSVEGYAWNTTDFLSLYVVEFSFQFYLKKKHADSKAVVKWFDVIEQSLGSPETFGEVFPLFLVDRGVEFDDWQGMERSCIKEGSARTKVFYCDPRNVNQKSQAERNHEQLRRILPKRRSNFDKLDFWDAAACTSHVNSYPLARNSGKCAMELISQRVPQKLFDDLGIEQIHHDNVVLKPYLMQHSVV